MRIFLSLLLVCIIVLLDQVSKYYVFDFLANKPNNMMEITSFFNLVTVRNYGISFGMFNNLSYGKWILTILAGSITIGLLYWLKITKTYYFSVALSLIIGGAIGNIIDRAYLGSVADFLDFHIFEYHWPAFNFADSYIFIGTMLVCLEQFFLSRKIRP